MNVTDLMQPSEPRLSPRQAARLLLLVGRHGRFRTEVKKPQPGDKPLEKEKSVSTKTSRVRRVAVGFIATLMLAGVGASSVVAATAVSAHSSTVAARAWNGG